MLKPVYALVSSDPFLQLEELVKLGKMAEGAQRVDVEGEKAELAEVLDELRSFSMFGSGKLVVVRDGDEFVSRHREALEKYVGAPSSSATLVLRMGSLPGSQRIAKLIGKVGEVIKCEPPGMGALPGWIVTRAKTAHGFVIDQVAARMLAELIGSDMGKIETELAKLAIGAEGKPVGVEMVKGSVTFQREQEMKAMTSALAAGRTAEAMKRWRQLLQTDPATEFKAVVWLTMWLEDVRDFLESPNGFKGSWKYRDDMNEFRKTAQAIGKERVGRLVDLLVEVDRQSKSGVGEMRGNVERFLLTAIGGK